MSARFFRLCLKLLRGGGVAVSFIFSLALVSAAEAEVCFLPTVGVNGSCSGSSDGLDPDPDKCPTTGYTAYASKPDCGIGKKAEQSGTVNGKGCYKCVDEKSSDCSRGKLEKDLGTCVDGKTKKEVGKTDSGLKCYECVDDVCPTGYTSDSESCKNSQNTGYAVLQEGVETPSGGLCYTCGSCQTGYQYQNSTPNDTECTHWTQEAGTPCYKSSNTANVDACPNGGTQTPCDASQTETGRYENSCRKICYKCEASDESEDPFAQCKFNLETLSRGEYEEGYVTYAAGPLHGRVIKMSDMGMFKEITFGDHKEELLSKSLDYFGGDLKGCYENANDECYQNMVELIKEDIALWNEENRDFPTEFIVDNNDILNSIIKCSNGYIDLDKDVPWICNCFWSKSGAGCITDVTVGDDYFVLPEGFFIQDQNNIGFSCEEPRTAKCPEGTTEINSSSNYCKSPRNDYYRSKICQCSVFEKVSDCGYCECISDVQGKHMGRISYTDDPAYVTVIEKDPLTGDEDFADFGYYYECGCIRGTKLWANECICPVDQIWSSDAPYGQNDDEEPTKKGKCVAKEVNKITITPKINVDTASVQCEKIDNGSGSSITYTFPVREIEINVKSDEAVNEDVTVYMWIIDAAYNHKWVEEIGHSPYAKFAPLKFTSSSSYQSVNCTIKKGKDSCSGSINGDFKVKTSSSYDGTRMWNEHTFNEVIRCPAELNSDLEYEFSPMIIPYRYIGVISSADDTYQYTADIDPKSWSDDPHGKVWFGEKLAQQINDRSKNNSICPPETWSSAPVCRPTGMQGDWGEEPWKGSWYRDVMSRLTSQKQPEQAYIKDKKYNTWPIKALNDMPNLGSW